MTTTVPMQAGPVAAPVNLYQHRPQTKSSFSKAALIIGILQICLSLASVIVGAVCIINVPIVADNIEDTLFGALITVAIWGGLGFYLVAGILAVVAGCQKGRKLCVIVCCLVMSALAAFTACIHVYTISYYIWIIDLYYDYDYGDYNDGGDTGRGVMLVSAIIGGLEFVSAIVLVVCMCCGAPICCGKHSNAWYASYVARSGHVAVVGNPMDQHQYIIGQPLGMGQTHVTGQPQPQNFQYMPHAQGQPPAYMEIK